MGKVDYIIRLGSSMFMHIYRDTCVYCTESAVIADELLEKRVTHLKHKIGRPLWDAAAE